MNFNNDANSEQQYYLDVLFDNKSETTSDALFEEMSVKSDFKDRYDLIEKINSGSFATVNKCRKRSNGQFYAVKFIKKNKLSKSNKLVILNEIMINRKLDHVNVVHLYETFDEKSYSLMVFELINGGELFDDIVQRSHYTEKDAHDYAIQMFDGLAYVHSQGIIHRDIKPENILLLKNENETVLKIADFGVAKDISKSGDRHFPMAGSLGYMAPEVACNKKNSVKVDAYSTGIILYILICGYPPFPQSNSKSTMLEATKHPRIHFNTKNWDSVTPECVDLTKKLTAVDPGDRISITDALNHKWLKRINDVSGSQIERQTTLEDFIQFNIKRKFMTMLGVFSIAGMITDSIHESKRNMSGGIDTESTSDVSTEDPKHPKIDLNVVKDHICEVEMARRESLEYFKEFLEPQKWMLHINQNLFTDFEQYKSELNKIYQNTPKLNGKDFEVRVQPLKDKLFIIHIIVEKENFKETIIYTLHDHSIVSCSSFIHR